MNLTKNITYKQPKTIRTDITSDLFKYRTITIRIVPGNQDGGFVSLLIIPRDFISPIVYPFRGNETNIY